MCSRREHGMTMIELVLAIAVIGVALAGVLTAFNTIVARSADPMVHKQLLAIAEGMMEEISLQPFAPTAATGTAINDCARNAFNDIQDYNGYQTTTGYCDIDGNSISSLAAYNVLVQVNTGVTLNGIGGGSAAQISVTVNRTGGGSFTLVGWRTFYAQGIQ